MTAYTRQQVATVALVVAALALGGVVTSRLPSADDVTDAPFVRPGVIGTPVELRTGTFTVTDVEASTRIADALGTSLTTGTWVVLHVDVTARREATFLAKKDLRLVTADGRKFGGYLSMQPTCGPAQPGLPLSCMVAIEAQPDALAGSHLVLPATDHGFLGPDENEFADIDLGISADKAAELAANTTPIKLSASHPKGA